MRRVSRPLLLQKAGGVGTLTQVKSILQTTPAARV